MIKKLYFLVLLSVFLTGCSEANILKGERNIRNDDITFTNINEGLSSATVNFTTHQKIKEVEITATFYDSKNKVVVSKTKTMTDLAKDTDYSLKFGVDFFDMLKIRSVEYTITSGIVEII